MWPPHQALHHVTPAPSQGSVPPSAAQPGLWMPRGAIGLHQPQHCPHSSGLELPGVHRNPRLPGAAGLHALQPSPSAGHSSRGTPWLLKAELGCQEQGPVLALHLLVHPPAQPPAPCGHLAPAEAHPCAVCCRCPAHADHVPPQDLGSKDLKRERLFLVCQIIRVGRMDLRETYSRKLSTGLRRPFGISGENRVCHGCQEETPQRCPRQHPPAPTSWPPGSMRLAGRGVQWFGAATSQGCSCLWPCSPQSHTWTLTLACLCMAALAASP